MTRAPSSLTGDVVARMGGEYSVGLGCLSVNDDSPGTLMRRADEALYCAKAQGGARLIIATDQTPLFGAIA